MPRRPREIRLAIPNWGDYSDVHLTRPRWQGCEAVPHFGARCCNAPIATREGKRTCYLHCIEYDLLHLCDGAVSENGNGQTAEGCAA